MKKPAKKIVTKLQHSHIDPDFAAVIEAISSYPGVSCSGGKGFGSGTLKVNDKIFAMMSSKGEFVVKLSKQRVDELVTGGKGCRFDPGHGRVMKEWVSFSSGRKNWLELAREAYRIVREKAFSEPRG